ncbi:MAG: DUF523 domain-containing protein [Candidatus Omnitrophica bacterium]|nr:DUF523 domain-containing protein [Candidatus Omnitrophota bacterium]MBU4488888.1 DUF523 domain-containing protein [Candidatus Omnitrophota bacterium]MCG2705476.1 DUF523 domain-containing protein [Candidatus Omnitrophota bacterium]
MILISGCLNGHNPSYDGVVKVNENMRDLVKNNRAIPVCPELLGGLSVPRERNEIKGSSGEDVIAGKCRVMSESGKDITKAFLRGAEIVLSIAKKHNIKKAVLKSKSPACGCGQIYDGTFTGRLIKGDGVTCALLKMNGIEVIDEITFENTSPV